MKQYLLDTCICIFLFRKKYGIEKRLETIESWKSHATLTLLAKQDCPLWLQYD